MPPPKGWNSYDVAAADSNRPVGCGCCDWIGLEDGLDRDGIYGIDNLYDRLDPGSIVPVGECPECDSLVYYNDVEIAYRLVPTILDKIVEAVEAD